ncbi:MAG: hypothetical protein LBI03_00155 [Clostridiales bacterium]|jgi:hypothetical protein|nr:hypothetical protein [Clostridiales bacterium]
MRNSDIFNSLEWQGNSKNMFNAIVREVPPIFAGTFRQHITNWIFKNNIKVVTEDTVFKAVDDIAPGNMAKMIKTRLEKLRLNPDKSSDK